MLLLSGDVSGKSYFRPKSAVKREILVVEKRGTLEGSAFYISRLFARIFY